MNRILNILLLLFVIMMLLSITALAAESIIQIGSAEAVPGESITIPVNITNSANLISLTACVEYDEDIMTLITIKDTCSLPGFVHGDKTTSPVVLTWENDCLTANQSVYGEIVELCFVVKNNALEGEYALSVHIPQDGALDSNGNDVRFYLVDGLLTITHKEEHVCAFDELQEENNRYHIKYCSCGEFMREKHNLEKIKTIPSTHTSEGEVQYRCTECDFEKIETIEILEGHTWSEYKKIDDLNHGYECECGKEIIFSHEWNNGEIIKNATETTEGEISYTCKECGAKITKSIPALGIKTFTLFGTVTSYGEDTTTVTNMQLYSGSGTTMDIAPTYTINVLGSEKKTYSFDDVLPGIYTLRVSKNGHITKDYIVTVDNEDVKLNVEITLKADAKVTMTAEITHFSPNCTNISIKASTSSGFFGQFFVASYDEQGRMLDVKAYRAAKEVLAELDNGGDSVKVFWVDNEESFKPVCPFVSISV